jgi:fucose 4-O-acetylase-like acetyltransferase
MVNWLIVVFVVFMIVGTIIELLRLKLQYKQPIKAFYIAKKIFGMIAQCFWFVMTLGILALIILWIPYFAESTKSILFSSAYVDLYGGKEMFWVMIGVTSLIIIFIGGMCTFRLDEWLIKYTDEEKKLNKMVKLNCKLGKKNKNESEIVSK